MTDPLVFITIAFVFLLIEMHEPDKPGVLREKQNEVMRNRLR